MHFNNNQRASKQPPRGERAPQDYTKNANRLRKIPDSQNGPAARSASYRKDNPLRWRHLDDDIMPPGRR
ncbi:MAG TPA: hypothetical protein VKB46_07380 [Pyrinomonadaceae bacterium]|nr:hypothetical protein [Pyrinomonadaceae bacterium]